MHIFFAPDITDKYYSLDEKESRHCVKVLRMKKGTIVNLIDGRGSLFEGVIQEPDSRRCIIEITSVTNDFEKRDYSLHIAISPLKNMERFEWFIEKSVEIGVDEITPVICSRTEKPGIKSERIKGLIISAMKQSLKTRLTLLQDPVNFEEFINYVNSESLMIAHCSNDIDRKSIKDTYKKGEDTVILIGPEGDFTNDEISLALRNGYKSVHLGKSRLRSETAGVAACHSIYFLNQEESIPEQKH
jgi:16S rRNA (uracil1498-N3)-methyltransferase